ncbi:MAG: hypothetical protein Q8Q29_01310 [Actinomycetota bacterium]|nr:hypothetical protein [Actinomycetota bacterium]
MTSADPRHGRWILPLMIAAMVVLTYTFVNSIEPAASPSGTTSADGPPFPTSPTSSTTTLPPELAAFMVTLDITANQATAYGEAVDRINTDWETRALLFAETRTAFTDLQAEVADWETDVVAQSQNVPSMLAAGHVQLLIEVSHLAPKIGDIVAGLEAPGVERRQAAVAEFQAAVQEVLDAIEAIRETARGGGATTTTTEGDGTDA